MNIAQMNTETKVERIASIKAQIEELQAQFDALRASIVEDLKAQNTKSSTVNGVKASFSTATYYAYKDSAISFLEGKGLGQCVEKKVKVPSVNACLKAGVITENELSDSFMETLEEWRDCF